MLIFCIIYLLVFICRKCVSGSSFKLFGHYDSFPLNIKILLILSFLLLHLCFLSIVKLYYCLILVVLLFM